VHFEQCAGLRARSILNIGEGPAEHLALRFKLVEFNLDLAAYQSASHVDNVGEGLAIHFLDRGGWAHLVGQDDLELIGHSHWDHRLERNSVHVDHTVGVVSLSSEEAAHIACILHDHADFESLVDWGLRINVQTGHEEVISLLE